MYMYIEFSNSNQVGSNSNTNNIKLNFDMAVSGNSKLN
jgi:hypothetical protein